MKAVTLPTSWWRTPVWLWPNLLSLDAPLVAVLWQDFLARCYPSTLLPAGRAALGLTVWAIYLADRLIDVRRGPESCATVRHNFHRRHARFLKVLLGVVVAADLSIGVWWLRPAVLSNGLVVGGAVTAYLLLFAMLRVGSELSKHLCAALLFTAGIFLVAWTSTRQASNSLPMPATCLGGLVLANLTLVQSWELRRRAPRAVLGILGAVLVLCACGGGSRWYGAIAVSAIGLAGLDWWGANLPDEARHVLADAVLLTPLVL